MTTPVETAARPGRRRGPGSRIAVGGVAVLLLAGGLALSAGRDEGQVGVTTADRPAATPSTEHFAEAATPAVDVPATVPPTAPPQIMPSTTVATTASTVRRPVVPRATPTTGPQPTTPPTVTARPAVPAVTGLYVVHADTGALRRLAAGRVYDPTWSPDGSRLAFIRDSQLISVSSDGTTERVIASSVQSAPPAWSPDGTRVAFIRGGAVFVVPAAGGEPLQVGDSGACAVAWSPDGTLIAFASMATMRNTLETVRPDGSERRVLSTSISCDGKAVWSPDSSRIGYLDFNIGPAVVDIATTVKTPLTTQRNMGWSMAWAPSGDEIAFADYIGTTNNLSIARADGGGVRTIATGGVAPDWSPSGGRIAFLGNRNPDRTGELLTHLHIIGSQGQGERIVVSDTRATHLDSPRWAPDGVHLAFSFTA